MDKLLLSQAIETAGKATIEEFLLKSNSSAKNVESKLGHLGVLSSKNGPCIKVTGKSLSYICYLTYDPKDNDKFLLLLNKTYPTIDNSIIPQIDVIDLLGEVLNITCGKINKYLESLESEFHIDIPYFNYGVDQVGELVSYTFSFEDISFEIIGDFEKLV